MLLTLLMPAVGAAGAAGAAGRAQHLHEVRASFGHGQAPKGPNMGF